MSSRQAHRLHRLRRKLRREKRGVILLVVVSLLTLFLMIGVTYVLIAGNYQNASAQNQRAHRYGDEPEREAEEILGQLLYGSVNPNSVLGPHNLLADLYGSGGVIGTVSTVMPTYNSGQTIYLQVNLTAAQPIPNYFGGRVITFTDGPAAGLSTRVMAYFPNGYSGSGIPELMVEAPESDLPIPANPVAGNRFIINGAPFSGTGAGLSQATRNLDDAITMNSGTAYPTALLPNYSFNASGGLNETWDAPDYQNMFLAMVPPRKLSQFDNFPLLPSFHRPDLVRYWQNFLANSPLLSGASNPQLAFLQPYGPDGVRGNGDDPIGLAAADEVVALKRMIIFRPLREDHPNFTGGNQNFLETNLAGPYDVDNDGDGITDSIWIDSGLPVITAPNGRRYKRLVAVLIKDLDGRVNPNAHGNLVLAPNGNPRTAAQMTDMFAGMDPTAPSPIYLPRGLGFGPAEVDFRHIFNDFLPYQSVNDNFNVYNNILTQRYFSNISGQAPYPGYSDGSNNVINDDGWSRLKTIGMPFDHTNPPFSAYSTPPDVWGRAALAMDYTGQPIWGFAGTGERIDDPYEIQWNSLRASYDSPYTVAELESLLRYHDLGTLATPGRLLNLGSAYLWTSPRGTVGPDQVRRESFGMGSYIPAPRLVVPMEMRNGVYGGMANNAPPTLLDLYAYKLGYTYNDFQTIVPFEFFKGQLFNLNREFGNGQQDQTGADQAVTQANSPPFGTVDDPSEQFLPEPVPTSAGPNAYTFNYLNDPPPSNNTPDPRQMYARHLYCLMMLLQNQNAPNSYDLDNDGSPTAQETARVYAQWAINVVDFRDPDSIMTPFEYDNNPFDGWSVDGVLGSADDNGPQRGLVWGCERPELLITETVNGHDRRTEDTDKDPTMKDTQDPVMKDDDFDQRIKPEGWTFIELYNPWFDRSNNSYDHKPNEIYSNNTGVDIARVNSGGSAVWRMLVTRGPNKNDDPDYPQPEALTVGINGNPPPANIVERSIYFADMDGGGVTRPSGDGEAYFPSAAIFPANTPRIPPISPGRYAVIGSAGDPTNVAGGNYSTNLGWRASESGPPARPTINPRQIILNPSAQTVRVTSNITDGADDTNAASLQSVVAIPIDSVIRGAATPQSLTISEPINGYPPQGGYVAPTATEEGYYSTPTDAPFDAVRSDDGSIFATNTTTVNYRVLHLQRLANPLLAWNPVSNPYITVDTSNMDVMSYNGATNKMDPQNPPGGRQNFQSFQRGGRFFPTDPEAVNGYTPPATGYFRRLWQQESITAPTADSPTEGSAEPHFQPRPLYHTLGGLNRRYYPYLTTGPAMYQGAPHFQDTNGQIAPPFPYMTFNNRPFNNPMELLQVPCWSSSKLLVNYIFQDPTFGSWINMYQPPNPPNINVPYGHLLNFFHTSNSPGNPSTAPELSRLLDYVETRSPYSDTEKYYNPAAFFNDPQTPAGYRPPFNYLSRFREPGRININTIFDDNVWNAAVRGSPLMCTFPQNTAEGDGGQFLLRMAMNRQGWGGANGADDLLTIPNYDARYPSYFSNPIRTADSADVMPAVQNLRQGPANGGLLRQDPLSGNAQFMPATSPPPFPAYPPLNGTEPLFASQSVTPYQDASRNPYFRFQPLQKVGNVFSTNSNCYAVWITVGYFEVESNFTPPVIDQAHPEGVRLAQEVGVDEGNVKRHRAFYIIDRSIPVAYEPGHRHNTDKAVLLKRYIE